MGTRRTRTSADSGARPLRDSSTASEYSFSPPTARLQQQQAEAFVDEGFRQLHADLAQARERGRDPVDRLVRMSLAWWDFAGREPTRYAAMHEPPADGAQLRIESPLSPSDQDAAQAVRQLLRDAVVDARGPAEPEEIDDATDVLRALLHGLALMARSSLMPGGRRRGAMLLGRALGEVMATWGVGPRG